MVNIGIAVDEILESVLMGSVDSTFVFVLVY